MKRPEGYIVAEKKSAALKQSRNLRYRGLYRTVPWSQDKYNEGWDDPLMSGQVGRDGLISNLSRAREVLRIYLEVEPAKDLEILYGSVCEADSGQDVAPGLCFLGFDVAGPRSPFWSIVGDFGPDPPAQPFLAKLNEHGLFVKLDEAKGFLKTYRDEKLPDYEFPLVLWAVWLAE